MNYPLTRCITKDSFPDYAETQKGSLRLKSTIDNFAHMLKTYGVEVSYNEIVKTHKLIIPGKTLHQDNAINTGLAEIKSLAARNELPVGQSDEYVLGLGYQSSFNPVLDWIKVEPWDNTDRFEELMNCIHVEQGFEKVKNIYFKKWMLAAVGLLTNNGTLSSRGVLVLQGNQNIGKSYFCRLLAGEMTDYFADGLSLDPSNKDSVKRFCSHWFVELGELDGTFRRSDVAALKAFLTNSKDIIRLPYERAESTFPRRTAAIATVNSRQFLADSTGNTRYWVLPVSRFDLEKLKGINKQQLWAQAQSELTSLQSAGDLVPWFLSQEQGLILDEMNAQFASESPVEIKMLEMIAPCGQGVDSAKLNATGVCDRLHLPHDRAKEVGRILQDRLGYRPNTKRYYTVEFNPACNTVTPLKSHCLG